MPTRPKPPSPEALALIAQAAEQRHGVFRVAEALEAGLTYGQVRSQVRRGAWHFVGRGALAIAEGQDVISHHVAACAARLEDVASGAVISHASAGVLYGLPYVDVPTSPTLTIPRRVLPLHLEELLTSRLPAWQRTTFAGLPITTGARAVVDLLRTAQNRYEAQGLADGFLRAGVEPDLVQPVLDACSGWPGIRQARQAWDQADARAESPLESRHRLCMRDGGLPAPELQAEIRDRQGRLVARVDFLYRTQWTVVESDGRVKYSDPQVLWDEKRREDRLRELGFEVVRATWADWEDGGAALVARILAAFERSARRRAHAA